MDIIDLYFTITEQEHPVKTKIIVADFSKGATAIDYIRNEIKNLEIGILGKYYAYHLTTVLCQSKLSMINRDTRNFCFLPT